VPGPEPDDGRGCAIEAQDVRVDRVPGLGPVEAGPQLSLKQARCEPRAA
jgi:hypothetical protein